jgi:hypothetical protein
MSARFHQNIRIGRAGLNATELAQLGDNVALVWVKHREDDELMRSIHARFIFNILQEFPHEILAIGLYQLPSGSWEVLTFLVLH